MTGLDTLATSAEPVRGKPALALLAAIAWAGVLLQLWLSIDLARTNGKSAIDGVVAYLGYFTVLSNLFVALAATLPLAARNSRLGQWFARPSVRGCATTAIVCVGIGYHLLLREIWDPQGWQLVADMVLHYVVPIGALAYWVGFPPRTPIHWRAPLAWCLYPMAYGVYALLRGEMMGTYPYPFIDVASLGYARVLGNTVVLLACFAVMGSLVVLIARQSARLGSRDRPRPGA